MGAICHSCLSHLSLWMWQVVWLLHISKCQLSVLRNGDLSRKADGFPGPDFPEDWSLDMHGCLWAFKQSIPPTRPPIQLPKKHPALYYILLYSLPPRSSMLRFCFSSPVGNVKRSHLTFEELGGLNRVISLNVYTALATEGCGVDEAGGFKSEAVSFPHLGYKIGRLH